MILAEIRGRVSMRLWWERWVVSAMVLGLMTATLSDFGMAWDEGYTVECEERVGEWFGWVVGGSRPDDHGWAPSRSLLEPRETYLKRAGTAAASPWSRESLLFYWPFAREAPIGHPPLFAVIGRLGWEASHWILPPPASFRFGAAALFSLTIGVVYSLSARLGGRASGLMAAVGLVTMPRVFAHAHFASFDAPTMCFWFLSVAAYLKAVEATGRRWVGWTVLFGVAWGCASATKFTGWFLPVPLAAWALWYRDRHAARTLALGGVVAAGVIYALIPPWWTEPIEGLSTFLKSNLTRREHSAIPSQFFGVVYPFSLPWYNTLLWTAIVVPPWTLGLALLGVARLVVGRFRDRAATLLFLCWTFLVVLRALPAAPGHDGVRQFLPAFVFLACLAGHGVGAILALAARAFGPKTSLSITHALVALALGASTWSTWQFHPVQLSYYNDLIGGLSGAAKAGMEPTYYWDALTPKARAWINAHTGPGQSIMFGDPVAPLEYLQHWGLLVPPVIPSLEHRPQWYVVQNRPGLLRAYPIMQISAGLLANARPSYVETASSTPDVPLVAIYPIESAAAVEAILSRQISRSPNP